MNSSNEPLRSFRRHGWLNLEHYLAIHDAQMRRFEDWFVVENGLTKVVDGPETLRIAGRIRCQGGLALDVAKTLAVDDRNRVRTIRYKYQAGLEGPPYRPIFRYDNAHPHPGHADEHHRHPFDPSTGMPVGRPDWVGVERWPTLADVLDELHEWWQETGRFVVESDA